MPPLTIIELSLLEKLVEDFDGEAPSISQLSIAASADYARCWWAIRTLAVLHCIDVTQTSRDHRVKITPLGLQMINRKGEHYELCPEAS